MSQGNSIAIAARRIALALAALAFALLFVTEVASAQSWWPFGGGGDDREADRPPVPQEPVYRQPPPGAPQGAPPDQAPPPAYPAPAYPSSPPPAASGPPPASPQQPATNWSQNRNPICLQLEQRLVQENQKNGQTQNDLPRLEGEIRSLERVVDQTQAQLDRGCYEYFLFTKSLRNTPQCKDLARQVDTSKRRLSDLDARRQDIVGSSGRSYQNDIIRELARNNCGSNYTDMARRAGGDSGGMWEDEESSGGNTWNPRAANGAQTYRTLCVRLCDGFYFPVSFSTLPSHFAQDAESCTSHCAAPTELYYYPNPGGTVEQSVALQNQEPYNKLKFAFRYRKEYVQGCSCKAAEYVSPDGDKKADATAGGAAASQRQAAAASSWPSSTGGTGANTTAPPPPVQSEQLPDAQPAPTSPSDAGASDAGGWQTQAQPGQ
ncbi:DUF2865 domain-containing protein [Hyphomicrobium sp.]|uniref:DUF2865 domain-containing protein n=1 Tax=Hyphomicrobium sp. TaxID=82 RepID=UPI000F9F35A0|nr:DUF2865 domain-containing protein [Hyphomicrobium sp.]RUO99125.1 MAG: DUF2865 domain-containing protein [Hyphomicrobium sp.]